MLEPVTESASGLRVAPKLCLVLPCYNEQEVLPSTLEAVRGKLESLLERGMVAAGSCALFVDDGSRDATWQLIEQANAASALFQGLKLAHNRGHQHALLAGYEKAAQHFDVAVSMDADLQDDIDAVDAMVEEYRKGADIVYGVRNDRETDTGFKRGTAGAFYKFMHWMGADTIDNHADFRLMDRRALEALAEYGERNLFLRGLIPEIGLETACVYYARKEREAGQSKYPLRKMLSFAVEGITSFSTKPLHLIGVLGMVAVLVAIVAIVYSIVQWALGNTIDGWATMIISIWFIGGVQLVCLSVLGEYIGKIYQETKRRPRYFVQKSTLDD